MLSFSGQTVYETSKCFFTYGKMGHVDPRQPPSKGNPWTALAALDFIHQVDLIMPKESLPFVQSSLLEDVVAPKFCRVRMNLGQILQGAFFTEYIKIGNIMMLSEGDSGFGPLFTLIHGKLTMYLERETYERAGLVGKPQGAKGKRGLKPRWIVEYDLRSPSMFRGKKGFDRLIYACNNVLNDSIAWAFCNLSGKVPDPDPLEEFQPTRRELTVDLSSELNAATPNLSPPSEVYPNGDRSDFEDFATEIYEWLSLIRLGSPRVAVTDNIDPYLSRYQLPEAADEQQQSSLCKVTWAGFLPASWVRTILIETILGVPSRSWFCLSASTLAKNVIGDNNDCVILRLPNTPTEYMLWEVKSS